MIVALPKLFKLDQQSRQEALKGYCSNIYTAGVYVVPGGVGPKILADPLSQPIGADYAHQITLAPPDVQTFLRSCTVEFSGKIRL